MESAAKLKNAIVHQHPPPRSHLGHSFVAYALSRRSNIVWTGCRSDADIGILEHRHKGEAVNLSRTSKGLEGRKKSDDLKLARQPV